MTIKRTEGPTFKSISQHDRDIVQTALKSGASRREVMGWLMAAGMAIGSAGSLVGAAGRANAATPKRGGQFDLLGTCMARLTRLILFYSPHHWIMVGVECIIITWCALTTT